MRKFLPYSIPAYLVSLSMLPFAGGCGNGPSSSELEAVNKQNVEDEMKPPPPMPKGQRPV